MCGRHGDGSATRLATLLIKTCQRWRVPYARGCVFPFTVNVFVPARVRAGKGAVYEIIYVESTVAAGGGCTAGGVQETLEKYKPACGLH